MVDYSTTAPGMASGNTHTAGAAEDRFTARGGNDAINTGGGDRNSGDSPLSGQGTCGVFTHDFVTAVNRTGKIATATQLGTGHADELNVLAQRNTLTGAAPGTHQDDFGVFYQSSLNIQTTGTYTFSTTSDDVSRIILRDASGAVVHDLANGRDQAAHTASRSVTLQAGQIYTIKVWCRENAGDSVFGATIAGPNLKPTDLAISPLLGAPPIAAGQVDGNGGRSGLSGQAGRDTITGSGGNNRLFGSSESDSLGDETGNDLLDGGAGSDALFGGTRDDTLIGGTDADNLQKGEGNKSVDAGAGADSLYGGDRRDTNSRQTGDFSPGDPVDGGNGGDESDTLDLSGYTWGRVRMIYDSSDPQSGTVTFLNPNGVSMGTMTVSEIETVIPCFTTGTLIETPTGPRPVESLRPGDLVLTLDDGPQPVRWIGQRRLGLADLMADPSLMPIEIGANALGRGCPRQAVNVSPRHRVLFAGAACELWFGAEEVLVPAKQLVGHGRITRKLAPVTYVHLMFDRHQIVQTHGMWSESYQPAAAALSAMPDLQREEILRLFPTLTTGDSYPAARMTLRPFETRVLLSA